jgi:hypothetical protein
VIRSLSRRLQQLETRANVAAARQEPHTICFVDVNKRVASEYEMGTGKWTYFDPDDRELFQSSAA